MPTKKQTSMPTGVDRVIAEKDFQNNRAWHFDPSLNILMTEVSGEWLSKKEFDDRFPINYPVNLYGGKKNPDTTRDYLY